MESKICSKCEINKLICDFTKNSQSKDGYYPSCKECRKKSRLKNPLIEKLSNKLWREKNKEHLQNYNNEWREQNFDYYSKWITKNPDYQKNYYQINREKKEHYQKNYYNENKSILLEKSNEYVKKRRKYDEVFRLRLNVRNRINNFIKNKGLTVNYSSIELLNCTPEFLKEHLEKQFTEGMSWGNYGYYGWHIDHVIPLSSAKTEEEIYKLCHYTNLQPLWRIDNMKKTNKIL